MKKRWFLPALVSLLLAGYANRGIAQEDTMKPLPPVVIYAKSNVNKAVTTAFDKQFKNAMDPQWYRMNKNFLVNFITGDMKNNALFKKNGRLVYHVSYGSEQNLPEDLRRMVQEAYADYNISRAVNVHMDNRNIWVVNLEGLKKWIIVRIEEGTLEEVESYNKTGYR